MENLPHLPTTVRANAASQHNQKMDNDLKLQTHPSYKFEVDDWISVLHHSVVIEAPVEKVNSDGKANLDILSTMKFEKELLNEQLIPPRYHVPAKT